MVSRASVKTVRSAAFVLDPSKLTRIVTIVEERFGALDPPSTPSFRLEFKRGKSIRALSLDEVLGQDNPVQNPIVALSIHAGDGEKNSNPECLINFDSDLFDNVALWVASEDHRWANALFAELEEQVDRTVETSLLKRRRRGLFHYVPLLTGIPLLLLTYWVLSNIGDPTGPQRDLIAAADTATSSEAKVDIILRMQVEAARQLEGFELMPLAALASPAALMLGVPLLVAIIAVAYVLARCYPRTVFLWGDSKAEYERLVDRRRTLWGVVVLALIIGVLSNFFAAGIAGLLRQ